ncbi:MAG: polyprenyl synthetase family protein [Phycisphaerales bacterium]|nr:polyprenyl synthetase family protein [Phycisphaerales bacterium]
MSRTISHISGTTSPQRASSDPLERIVARFEDDLDNRLAEARIPENLREAVRYSALGGGKRLRPVLAVLCCEAVGGSMKDALPAAAAIELIHAFSLVHDDLPAMDNDDLRRGQPTLHIHAGQAMAILAGDVMMSLAFEFISEATLEASQRVALAAELARATTAMIAGQVYDTLGGFEPGADTRERLELIHQHKTAALIRAACRMGAICGQASAGQLQAITQYGETTGLMFQIVDDLLDITQSAEHIGKATGKDETAGKLTYPRLYGEGGSRKEIERLRKAAHESLAKFGQAAGPLGDLCDRMAIRTK